MPSATPAPLARPRAQRWALRALLALVALAQVLACQAVLDTSDAAPVPAAASSCQGDPGHDVLCPTRAVPTAAPLARGTRAEDALPALGLLVALVLAGAALTAALRTAAGPPLWAPRRPVAGRHRLAAIGITRI